VIANSGNLGIGTTSSPDPVTIQSTGNQLRLANGTTPSVIFRNDGSNFYLMLTANNDPWGTWNTLRPFYFDTTSGNVTMGQAVTVSGALTANGAVWTSNLSASGWIVLTSGAQGIQFRDGSQQFTAVTVTPLAPIAGATINAGQVYQNTTGRALHVSAWLSMNANNGLTGYSSATNPPTNVTAAYATTGSAIQTVHIFFMVPVNYYYEIASTAGAGLINVLTWN
jgi:hypothetical protein